MTPNDSESWSTLHDMALLYLFLAHATDAQLDPAEKETMVERLTTWQAISDDARLAKVIDEALLIYMGSHSHDMLNTVMVSLKEAMSVPDRIAILNDLAALASADGKLIPTEVGFIQDLASFWEIEGELREQMRADQHGAGGTS